MAANKQKYSRCFISAPYGLDLAALPFLLGERQIAWNWSDNTPVGRRYASTIQRCDFTIAILNGSQSDQRVLYEVGLSEGFGKPVFIIATSKRVGKVARSLFAFVDVKLSERDALAFNLDTFLSMPHEKVFERDRPSASSKSMEPREPVLPAQIFDSELEARVYAAIVEIGGSAIAHPKNKDARTRPDLLMWLGSQDSELFDPAVIEIKGRVDLPDVKRIEQQLFDFMQASGVGCGFILTGQDLSVKRRSLSPYIFWLSVDQFITLTRENRLGHYVRELRNRAVHGAA